jgi:hypothetical protein
MNRRTFFGSIAAALGVAKAKPVRIIIEGTRNHGPVGVSYNIGSFDKAWEAAMAKNRLYDALNAVQLSEDECGKAWARVLANAAEKPTSHT